MGARGRDPAPGGFEDRGALGMLHPDETAVARMPLLLVANARREGVAGSDDGALARDKDRADLPNAVRAAPRRMQRRLKVRADLHPAPLGFGGHSHPASRIAST